MINDIEVRDVSELFIFNVSLTLSLDIHL